MTVEQATMGLSPHTANKTDLSLAAGTMVNQYKVKELLSYNGESSLYLVEDKDGKSHWLREFLPRNMVSRNRDSMELIPNDESQTIYKYSMAVYEELFRPFRGEAQAPEYIQSVEEQFYANNTVYIVQEALQLKSLKEYMAEKDGPISWTEAKKRMLPLMNSVSQLHDKGVIHLAICPENLYVSEEGPLILSGFSTLEARTVDGELDQELCDGFSAPEQYSGGDWKGGTWSDVYALAAVMYWLLCGTVPQSAGERLKDDELLPTMEVNHKVPESISDAISGAMMLDCELRCQVVDDFTSALLESVSGNTTVYEVADLDTINENTVHLETIVEEEEPEIIIPPKKRSFGKFLISCIAFILVALGLGFGMYLMVSEYMFEHNQQEETPGEEIEELYPVPDLVGHKYSDIINNPAYTENFNFNALMEYSSDYPEGVIIAQSIEKNVMAKKFSTVVLTVSKGKETIPMPNLVGFNIFTARTTLDTAGIAYKVYTVENKAYGPNTVFRTDPPADTALDVLDGTEVKIYVTPEKPAEPEKDNKKDNKKDDEKDDKKD